VVKKTNEDFVSAENSTEKQAIPFDGEKPLDF